VEHVTHVLPGARADGLVRIELKAWKAADRPPISHCMGFG
jgi:hypothetical protein